MLDDPEGAKRHIEMETIVAILKAMYLLHPEREAVKHLVGKYLESRFTNSLYSEMPEDESSVIESYARKFTELILSDADIPWKQRDC